MSKKRLTEFDFDKAKEDKVAVTRSGVPARLLTFDRYDSLYKGCIIALLKGLIASIFKCFYFNVGI